MDASASLTDDELLAQQDALQREAAGVLEGLALLPLLAEVGQPVQVGSVALGLMAWRDIDLTVLCPTLDPAWLFDVMRRVAAHPRVHGLRYRNDTGRWNTDPSLPDGIYWGIQYVTDADDEWKLDVWFLHEETRQPDMTHLETIPPRLDAESRLAILRLKAIWHRLPVYRSEVRSIDIYTAVLDDGVRSEAEFRAWLRERGKPA